jgi:CHAD domain-containing protein
VVTGLRRELESARERRAAALHQALDGTLTARVQARCDAVVTALDATRSQRWRRALASRLRRRATRLSRTVAAAGTLYAPETLHRVRIAAKKLRYALELAHVAARRPARRMLAVLKETQDGLGHWHDVQVLEDFVRRLDSDSVDRVKGAEYRRVADALELECRAAHARFLAERGAIGRVASQIAREIVPALTRKTGAARPARPATARAAAAP